ncbi:MAG: sigma-70 family RNA polymerase sigma factor [Planctomycetes bacterium]|nr:sigma-70 family RNA polymerase sigma factor [Planctomycetota bacterium]
MLHYLVKIAENKVRDQQVKYFATQRHNLGRDKPLDAVAGLLEGKSEIGQARMQDAIQQSLKRLPPAYRMVAELLLAGNTPGEIAALLGLKTRRVYQIIQHVREAARKDGWMDGWMDEHPAGEFTVNVA